MRIAASLDHAAPHSPDRPAVIEGSGSASFSEFNRISTSCIATIRPEVVEPIVSCP
jgi:hypothetical protein